MLPVNTNWGNCMRPYCDFQSPRCVHHFCETCCTKDHHFIHMKPWDTGPKTNGHASWCPCESCAALGKTGLRLPNGAPPVVATNLPVVRDIRSLPMSHPITCVCALCLAKARAKQEPEPKLGDMVERELLDWPLRRESTATVQYGSCDW